MGKKQDNQALAEAVKILGGYESTGKVCGVSGKAVQKWVKAGRLPRTEATGETNYSRLMAGKDSRISRDELLATVMQRVA
ncbi:MAG: hypothetical protein NUV63_02985 [Gallionella sp.]|nr:hypothetical protein [Gallionella sp.]